MSWWSSKAEVNNIDIALNINNDHIRLWESEHDQAIFMTYAEARELVTILLKITEDQHGS